MYKRCLFLKKDTNCEEQRSMAEKFEYVRLSCSGTTANSDNFTQQSSLLVVEAFATKPCWTSYWVSFRDVASYFGCCRKGLCFFVKTSTSSGGEPGISSHAQHIVRPVLVKARTILLFSVNCCSSLQKRTNGTHKWRPGCYWLSYIYGKPESCLLVVVVICWWHHLW